MLSPVSERSSGGICLIIDFYWIIIQQVTFFFFKSKNVYLCSSLSALSSEHFFLQWLTEILNQIYSKNESPRCWDCAYSFTKVHKNQQCAKQVRCCEWMACTHFESFSKAIAVEQFVKQKWIGFLDLIFSTVVFFWKKIRKSSERWQLKFLALLKSCVRFLPFTNFLSSSHW